MEYETGDIIDTHVAPMYCTDIISIQLFYILFVSI